VVAVVGGVAGAGLVVGGVVFLVNRTNKQQQQKQAAPSEHSQVGVPLSGVVVHSSSSAPPGGVDPAQPAPLQPPHLLAPPPTPVPELSVSSGLHPHTPVSSDSIRSQLYATNGGLPPQSPHSISSVDNHALRTLVANLPLRH
jgi:hypothetical protein